MSVTDDLLHANTRHAETFGAGGLPLPPRLGVAVLTCMDARLDPAKALGLSEGDAHVVRNAGGIATDDAIRSLLISQHLLGTREVLVITHTGCGMTTFRDEDVTEDVERETGVRPGFALGAFPDAAASARDSVTRLRASPFLPSATSVRGFVYDVDTGVLREVGEGLDLAPDPGLSET